MSTFIPRAVAQLAASHPGVQVGLIDAHSDDALQMLVSGEVDIVVGFHTDEDVAGSGLRSVFLGEDPIYLLVPDGAPTSMNDLRDSDWVVGCPRCRAQLCDLAARFNFVPKIRFSSDDVIVKQAIVAAGLAVATTPGLALQLHHADGVTATPIPGARRRILAFTYGDPPDPPATVTLLDALTKVTSSLRR